MSGGDSEGPAAGAPDAVEPEVESVLAEMLQEAEDLLPFARAVIVHLSRGSGAGMAQMQAATHVLEALAWGVLDGDAGETPFSLDSNPELLASFFQNADLLDPRSPRTAAIAKGVMNALQRIGTGSDE